MLTLQRGLIRLCGPCMSRCGCGREGIGRKEGGGGRKIKLGGGGRVYQEREKERERESARA